MHMFWSRVRNDRSKSSRIVYFPTSYWSYLSEILQVFGWEHRPYPYSTRILGVFLLDQIAGVVAPRFEDLKLIIPVFNFELAYLYAHGKSKSQTDGRTDGRLTIAIPRSALRASRGKNIPAHLWHTHRDNMIIGSGECGLLLQFIHWRHIVKSQHQFINGKFIDVMLSVMNWGRYAGQLSKHLWVK